jgi:hypothetical protein
MKQKKPLRAKTGLAQKTKLQSAKPLQAKNAPAKRRSKRIDIKAANLARAIWRTKGKCESCKAKAGDKQMQGAHIIGTGASPRLASDLRNGFCLCASCHRRYTSDPLAFHEFTMTTWAKDYYKTLRRLQKRTERVNWPERIDFLKDIKRAIEAGEMDVEVARTYEDEY